MKSQARVVIIGGGINGCSLLYHLTKLGWTDVTLVEKNELTSGSTWLAAGNVVQWTPNRCNSRLHKYSIELYRGLEAETGHQTGWQTTGSLRLATTAERMDEYRYVLSKDHALGIECALIDPDEAKVLFPFMHTNGLVGAMHHILDGHCDPAGTTMALATAARRAGATISRFNRVTDLTHTIGGDWKVHTEKGDIICEIVVNAAGLWASRIAQMVNTYLPTVPIEHHHLLFDDIPEITALDNELISLRDPDVPYYARKEGRGLLIGPYESNCKAWCADGVAWDWAQQELPADLERIQHYVLKLMDRVPMLKEAGLKHISNGPIAYTPDGQQLMGPVYGVKNFWCLAGCNFGITQAGGVGKYLAEWIVEGEPSIDLSSLDSRRFGNWTSKSYTLTTALEAYRLQYQLAIPDTERAAGRPVTTGPIYDLQLAQGAVFGSLYGWERANWFASKNTQPIDDVSFRRHTNSFEHVGRECVAAKEHVAIYELSSFAKFLVSGSSARAYLDRLTSGRLPKPGRVAYNLMLTPSGRIAEDMTLTCLTDDSYYIVAPTASELRLLQHLHNELPKDNQVTITNITAQYGVLAIVGPHSRELLSRLTKTDLSSMNFPHCSWQSIHVGSAPARAIRINFVGELGWELHHDLTDQRTIYKQLIHEGQAFGLVNCGMRSVLNSMRLEKGYLLSQDISGEETPLEAGLSNFVDINKGSFIGRTAVRQQQLAGAPIRLVTMIVDAGDADARGNESIWQDKNMIGRVTSGGWGHRVKRSLALGYVDSRIAKPGTQLSVEILNQRRPATIVRTPYYDPGNVLLRS